MSRSKKCHFYLFTCSYKIILQNSLWCQWNLCYITESTLSQEEIPGFFYQILQPCTTYVYHYIYHHKITVNTLESKISPLFSNQNLWFLYYFIPIQMLLWGFNYQINVLYSYKMMLFAQFCNLSFNKILLVIQVQ